MTKTKQPAFKVKQRPDGRWEVSCRTIPDISTIAATADEAIAAHKKLLLDFDTFKRKTRAHFITQTCGGNCEYCLKEREPKPLASKGD